MVLSLLRIGFIYPASPPAAGARYFLPWLPGQVYFSPARQDMCRFPVIIYFKEKRLDSCVWLWPKTDLTAFFILFREERSDDLFLYRIHSNV